MSSAQMPSTTGEATDANAGTNFDLPIPRASGNNINIVRPYGYSNSDCGYCKGSRSSVIGATVGQSSKSYSVLVENMTPEAYELFICRGWRRSGIHLYKPCNFESCCPTLTIRLPVQQYQPTKSQRQIPIKLDKRLNKTVQAPSSDISITSKQHRDSLKQKKKKQTGALSSNSIVAKTSVLESGVLDSLQTSTTKILQEIIKKDNLPVASSSIPAIKFKFITPSKKKQKQWIGQQSQQTRQEPATAENLAGKTSVLIQISTAVCAQLSGLKGVSKTRKELSDQLVQQLRNAVLDSSHPSISFVGFDRHGPSGHVLVDLKVDIPIDENSNATAQKSYNSQPMEVDDEFSSDPLSEWYQETFRRPMPTGTNRSISRTTVPAHESALDPRVHQLYALYQHHVHGDPDPFNPESNPTSDVDTTMGDAGDADTNNDRSDGKAASSNNSVESPMEVLSQLDWGVSPKDWKERVEAMMNTYLEDCVPSKYDSLVGRNAFQTSIIQHYYGFYQFLVESPLPLVENGNTSERTSNQKMDELRNPQSENPSSVSCGTYHQQYKILDDILIAVGVIDILPNGVSSVYLFYHPTLGTYLKGGVALGKYAIVQEIEYTKSSVRLPYYYLGYYIESCQKMKYKADYQPSQLLCPTYYRWVDATGTAIPLLQQSAPRHVCSLYSPVPVKLAANGESTNADNSKSSNADDSPPLRRQKLQKQSSSDSGNQEASASALRQVPMDIGANMTVTIGMLQESGQELVRPLLEEFIREAGPELAMQCILRLT